MNMEIDLSGVTLKSERLILRTWKQSDLNDFYEYASVDGVGQMAGWKPHESMEESQQILNHFIEGKKTFALVYQGKVIGSLGIEFYDEERFPEFKDLKCREIGFVLSRDYWGKGMMAEALQRVNAYMFETLHADVLICGHFKGNHQSARVQEKCGFHYYGEGTYHTLLGTDVPDIVNILTRKEWEKQ